MPETILVTGSSGFIGYSVSKSLLAEGNTVIGVDNWNEYYEPSLKQDRHQQLSNFPEYHFFKADCCDLPTLKKIFAKHHITKICHLAAQAGVRYSIENPFSYQKANLEAFLNMLELAREFAIQNFVYASSSSVYGNNKELPFKETHAVNTPISLYAATKRANELMAHTYSHLFSIPTTGLRFFTVYGPYGRPDMALFLFARAIFEGRPIDVYNHGNMRRSFSFIDDIVAGVRASLNNPFPYEIFNLGNDKSASLMEYIEVLEEKIGKKAIKNFLPI